MLKMATRGVKMFSD